MTAETLLLRQVHPSWVQGNVISSQTFSSQTFRPTPKDHNLLSVFNGRKFTAQQAFNYHIEELRLRSAGVVAVTLAECQETLLEVLEDNDPVEGHCSIDYRSLTNADIRKAAARLKDFAQVRGWLYQAE